MEKNFILVYSTDKYEPDIIEYFSTEKKLLDRVAYITQFYKNIHISLYGKFSSME